MNCEIKHSMCIMKYRVNVFFMLTSAVFFVWKQMDCVVMSVCCPSGHIELLTIILTHLKVVPASSFFVTLSVLSPSHKWASPQRQIIYPLASSLQWEPFWCHSFAVVTEPRGGNRETAGPAWASATKIVPPSPSSRPTGLFGSSHRWWEGDFGVQPLLSLLCLDS